MWSRLHNGASLLLMAMIFCHLVDLKGITMTGKLTTPRRERGLQKERGFIGWQLCSQQSVSFGCTGIQYILNIHYWYCERLCNGYLKRSAGVLFNSPFQLTCTFHCFFELTVLQVVWSLTWYLSIEMGMNWVWQDAIIGCLCGYIGFALICEFISAFLIASMCVVLAILLWTCSWFLCELLS